MSVRRSAKILIALLFALFAISTVAQQFKPELFQSLRWRSIGPYRGGRTRAVAGVPSQANVFYIGVCNGGVWRTTDYGRTWTPIFDDQSTGSIGAVAVAPSNPNIIYVGSGEGLQRPDLSVGDGIYKSSDAGKTWEHLALRDGQQIRNIAIDPREPNKLLVAVVGHPYGPNEERGIFRSTDGGKTFQKTLYKDENTGASDVLLDPTNPNIAYAALWEARQGPWENAAWNGTGAGIYKSHDGGQTWKQLTGGLPAGIVQANLAIASSDSKRLISTVATKDKVEIYRSDDAGQSWRVITNDARPAGRIGGGDLSQPRFDTKNPDIVYVTSTVTWKSTDGGETWTGFRGAPGGDDYQNIWINPNDPKIILLASDQGAIITVNGGDSWSSWYNQPTAQMYHASADNAFPYRVCGGQQESGSACVSSRSNDGAVTFRDWHPVAAEEYGYVAPDPLDPDIIYGGKLTRYDRRTAQAQNIMPKPFRTSDFRVVRTQPVLFSPIDPHVLYFATNTLWQTSTGGKTWQQISPDLTRTTWDVPTSVGKYKAEQSAQPTQRGVIYAVAPSPVDKNVIWAGTDDGLIHLTTDSGAHWTNITPPQISAWQKISVLDASHIDANTAYAAVNTLRLDDLRPHIFRTHDSGKTWTEIVNGIPANENVNAVREDPVRKGMLFASTERAVYVSFDDGDHWQSLRLNMPASSVRDVIVKGDDLIAATHGRGFWILDNISPLRQLTPEVTNAAAHLFAPQTAVRVRWNSNTDTPLPPDEPAGENPPDGAIIDYYIAASNSAPVTLEIRDVRGAVARRFSSADPVPPPDPMLAIPRYWVRPPQSLAATPGMHRFLWDMHYAPMPGIKPSYPIAAIPHNTAPDTISPWVNPAQYTAVLNAGGKSYTQSLKVEMDPRVKTPASDLDTQFKYSKQLYDDAVKLGPALQELASIRAQIEAIENRKPSAEVTSALDALSKKLQEVGGGGEGRGRRPGREDNLGSVRASLLGLMGIMQDADVAPTKQATDAIPDLEKSIPTLLQKWEAVKAQNVSATNTILHNAKLPELNPEKKSNSEQELPGNEE
jgi:photosystem II stability/assembly factor-like uncharacterized protein